MQRPTAKAVATAATLIVLLAGCGGADDKGSGGDGKSGETPPTPQAPPVAAFDPPKDFTTASAFGAPDVVGVEDMYSYGAGMVGQTALLSGDGGLKGYHIAAQREPWTTPSSESPDTIKTTSHSKPMPLTLDGKDVVGIVYSQSNSGGGTQKAHGQVLFQWLDAADGKKIAEATFDASSILGPGGQTGNIYAEAYDAATGQIAIAVDPDGGSKPLDDLTVFADPKTQKATGIPGVAAAGVLNGVVVAGKASRGTNATDSAIVVADGATGKISKTIPTKQNDLNTAGHGAKRAYLSGSTYQSDPKTAATTYNNVLYSVDIATGAVVEIKPALANTKAYFYKCLGDQAAAVVCSTGANGGTDEIVGIDDTTGKKAWGYTSESASRVVPIVSAAFHGVIYGQAQNQPIALTATDGQDIPLAKVPGASSTPTQSASGHWSPTPDASTTAPSIDPATDPAVAWGSDLSLYNNQLGVRTPDAVTQYGGAYLQGAGGNDFKNEKILVTLKPTA